MLAISDSTYGDRFPFQLGTSQINRALYLVLPEELEHLSICWKRGRTVTLLSGKSAQANIMSESRLYAIKGTTETIKLIAIPPFQTIKVTELSKIKGHDQNINNVVQSPEISYSNLVSTVPIYSHLSPGQSHVDVTLQYLS